MGELESLRVLRDLLDAAQGRQHPAALAEHRARVEERIAELELADTGEPNGEHDND